MSNTQYCTDIEGTVFDIERSATLDGPGIRTTVFLKGCYLRCAWCHNPESIDPRPELMYRQDKCISDLACYRVCPTGALWLEDEQGKRIAQYAELDTGGISIHRMYDINICQRCGACADVCYANALEMVGQSMSVRHVYEQVSLDRAFYGASGGGMTLTGGEPLFQPEFSRNLLAMCQANGIHTALDTTAFGPWDRLQNVCSFADLVLLDLKLMDDELHRRYTGVSNESILQNATRLADRYRTASCEQEGIWIRIPVIPGINDSEANIEATARFVRENMLPAVRVVELLGYHRLGVEKRSSLGQAYELDTVRPPSEDHLRNLSALVQQTLDTKSVRTSFR